MYHNSQDAKYDDSLKNLSVEKRVDDGIAFLNNNLIPSWWPFEINLDTLCIFLTDECVLSHIYGDYEEGYFALGLNNYIHRVLLGFTWENGFDYKALNQEWKRRIALLQAKLKEGVS
jgi:hypothetical protein